jgi:hypothetical protein
LGHQSDATSSDAQQEQLSPSACGFAGCGSRWGYRHQQDDPRSAPAAGWLGRSSRTQRGEEPEEGLRHGKACGLQQPRRLEIIDHLGPRAPSVGGLAALPGSTQPMGSVGAGDVLIASDVSAVQFALDLEITIAHYGSNEFSQIALVSALPRSAHCCQEDPRRGSIGGSTLCAARPAGRRDTRHGRREGKQLDLTAMPGSARSAG